MEDKKKQEPSVSFSLPEETNINTLHIDNTQKKKDDVHNPLDITKIDFSCLKKRTLIKRSSYFIIIFCTLFLGIYSAFIQERGPTVYYVFGLIFSIFGMITSATYNRLALKWSREPKQFISIPILLIVSIYFAWASFMCIFSTILFLIFPVLVLLMLICFILWWVNIEYGSDFVSKE